MTRMFLLALAGIVAMLAILWFGFLRTTYAPVYQNIREADASAIVAELDAAGIPYRLTNEGHDIEVPEEQVAQARVAVAGSDIAIGGAVGFELFNDSDMGLTEFAQKINFQRAMQGELSRSIMMMDGIEFARVHLAIPERTIFKSGQESPKAAVTLEMAAGTPLSNQRIRGIQQLVASSVPGLLAENVAILDSAGDLVSDGVAPVGSSATGPVTERAALETYFAAKARSAIDRVLPGLSFDVELTVRPTAPDRVDQLSAEGGTTVDRSTPSREGTAFRILVRTPMELSDEDRAVIQTALVQAMDLSEPRGDVLAFSTGALSRQLPAEESSRTVVPAAPVAASPAEPGWGDETATLFSSKWTWILLVVVVLVALVLWPRRRLAEEETASFAELLKSSVYDRNER